MSIELVLRFSSWSDSFEFLEVSASVGGLWALLRCFFIFRTAPKSLWHTGQKTLMWISWCFFSKWRLMKDFGSSSQELMLLIQTPGCTCVCSYLKHRCSHTGKFHTECFSVLYAFSCDCCIGLHHFLSHHITYTERVCHCVSCTGAVPITPGKEIFLSTCCKHNPSWCSR